MESNVLTQVFLPLSLAVIMFGMGITLKPIDFKRIFIFPKAVTLGLVNQLIILPAIAFGLIQLFGMQPELAVGMMILAACPGGATSNLITYLAKGDAALSVTLTAIASLVTVITIPIIVNFSIVYFIPGGEEQQLNVLNTVIAVLFITIIPVLLGMMVLKKAPLLAGNLERPFKIISTVFFVVIVVAALLKEKENIVNYFSQVGPVSLALNLATLGVGYFSARFLGLSIKQAKTISIESGIQNGTLGITIGATLLMNSTMTIPSAVYGLLMFLTSGILIYVGNKMGD
ncbi:bile acid:sodium symporter family protein [Algoriphagus sediminis]|uniref:Bile acid:sodium symporter family protein n=1 Tax=Algoriphagus sediminis TaxID=3057113 RepID=A0ABT7Y8J0_9BACT|nr:bile acid:sodium symporter family protein [Algoriphagus sediminis]MDN3202819.1 bile acid:sodium symporter family protein [Algoriphagus sediminis]